MKEGVLFMNMKNNERRRYFVIIVSVTLLAVLLAVLSPFFISRKPSIDDIVVTVSNDEDPLIVSVETLNDNISLTKTMLINIQDNICYISPKVKKKSFLSNNNHHSYELDVGITKIDAVYLSHKNNETQLLWVKEIN